MRFSNHSSIKHPHNQKKKKKNLRKKLKRKLPTINQRIFEYPLSLWIEQKTRTKALSQQLHNCFPSTLKPNTSRNPFWTSHHLPTLTTMQPPPLFRHHHNAIVNHHIATPTNFKLPHRHCQPPHAYIDWPSQLALWTKPSLPPSWWLVNVAA